MGSDRNKGYSKLSYCSVAFALPHNFIHISVICGENWFWHVFIIFLLSYIGSTAEQRKRRTHTHTLKSKYANVRTNSPKKKKNCYYEMQCKKKWSELQNRERHKRNEIKSKCKLQHSLHTVSQCSPVLDSESLSDWDSIRNKIIKICDSNIGLEVLIDRGPTACNFRTASVSFSFVTLVFWYSFNVDGVAVVQNAQKLKSTCGPIVFDSYWFTITSICISHSKADFIEKSCLILWAVFSSLNNAHLM